MVDPIEEKETKSQKPDTVSEQNKDQDKKKSFIEGLMEEFGNKKPLEKLTIAGGILVAFVTFIWSIDNNIIKIIETLPRLIIITIILILIVVLGILAGIIYFKRKEKSKIIYAIAEVLVIIILGMFMWSLKTTDILPTPTPVITGTLLPTQFLAAVPTQTPLTLNTLLPASTQIVVIPTAAIVKGAPTTSPFYIYKDADYGKNHYFYSGVMGDIGDLTVNESYIPDGTKPTETWIEVNYEPAGKGDVNGKHSCRLGEVSDSMCTWAGAYWLDPADNFGSLPVAGYDLSAYSNLKFRARAKDQDINVKFLVGGVGWSTVKIPPYPSSIRDPATTGWVHLTSEWQEFSIVLSDYDLSHVIDGFGFIVNWSGSGMKQGDPARVFYIDEIYFEK